MNRRTVLLGSSLFLAMPALAGRPGTAPLAGADAPDFELRVRGTDETLRLSSFEGNRPVALVFGSYT